MNIQKNEIYIIHFQPLESYPPIINLLDFVADKFDNLTVISTKNNIQLPEYTNNKIRIFRFATIKENAGLINRFIQYNIFYLGCLTKLLANQPKKILYYETLSSFPAIIYYYLSFKKVKLLAHYHEYSSPEEYKTGMFLAKWFHRLEKKTYPYFNWISQTNNKRMDLFLKDNTNIQKEVTKLLPNYPPQTWYCKAKEENQMPVHFVYVGSFGSFETLYIKEFLEWIKNQAGNANLDIYSFNIPDKINDYIISLNCKYIQCKGNINYKKLPGIFKQYDIGLILYKGHIPNYVYNAPNKLFEYLASGLDVWVPQEIEGSWPYATKSTYPKISMVDFKQLGEIDLKSIISRQNLSYKPSEYYCEPVYAELTNFIFHV